MIKTKGHSDLFRKNPKYNSTYNSWIAMIRRCYDKNFDKFKFYGKRGIRVCKRWMNFRNFISDMGARPPGHTLGRKNNHKGYVPSNCRWETWHQQRRNKSNNIKIYFEGKSWIASDLARHLGMNPRSFNSRRYHGWSIRKIITTPLNASRRVSFNGEDLTKKEWGKKLGLCPSAISNRLIRGWPIEKALTLPAGSKYYAAV